MVSGHNILVVLPGLLSRTNQCPQDIRRSARKPNLETTTHAHYYTLSQAWSSASTQALSWSAPNLCQWQTPACCPYSQVANRHGTQVMNFLLLIWFSFFQESVALQFWKAEKCCIVATDCKLPSSFKLLWGNFGQISGVSTKKTRAAWSYLYEQSVPQGADP